MLLTEERQRMLRKDVFWLWKCSPLHSDRWSNVRSQDTKAMGTTLILKRAGRLNPEDVTGSALVKLIGSEAKTRSGLAWFHVMGWLGREGHDRADHFCEYEGGKGLCNEQPAKFTDDKNWRKTRYVATERLQAYFAAVYLRPLYEKYPELEGFDDTSVLRLAFGFCSAWDYLVDAIARRSSEDVVDINYRKDRRHLREHRCAIIGHSLLAKGVASGAYLLQQLLPQGHDNGCDRHRFLDMIGVLEKFGLLRTKEAGGAGWRRHQYEATSLLASAVNQFVVPQENEMLKALEKEQNQEEDHHAQHLQAACFRPGPDRFGLDSADGR